MFSVVLPVYNGRATLSRAIESVLQQTDGDLELIVVDDGSTDGSGGIARGYAERDGRVRPLTLPENRGLGCARNAGMDLCSGEYLTFLDADDAMEPTLLETLRETLDEAPSDWIVWGVTEERYGRGGRFVGGTVILPEPFRADSPAALRGAVMPLESKTLFGYVWNKLYRLSILRERGLRFERAELIEDVLYNVGYARCAGSLTAIPYAGSRYAKRRDAGRLTSRPQKDYFELSLRRIRELHALHIEWGMDTFEVRKPLAAIYVRAFLSELERNCRPERGLAHRERRARIESLYDTAVYADLIPCFRSDRAAMRFAGRFIRKRMTGGLLFVGRALHIMRRFAGPLYERALRAR